MSSASKRQDDHDADRAPVPPYAAEVDGTWQAFRVTLRDSDGGDSNDAASNDAASNNAASNNAASNDVPVNDDAKPG
jgi:hypothetical protein